MPAPATTVTLGQLVGGHERLDHRQHGLGFGLVPLERADHQREPAGIGQQANGDLRLQAPLLGEPALPETITRIGLEIQGGAVVKDQAGPAQPRMPSARR
jgi:hypothetical protein